MSAPASTGGGEAILATIDGVSRIHWLAEEHHARARAAWWPGTRRREIEIADAYARAAGVILDKLRPFIPGAAPTPSEPS